MTLLGDDDAQKTHNKTAKLQFQGEGFKSCSWSSGSKADAARQHT